jgi:hypothetical protein
MNCYPREYLDLKRVPLLAANGEAGTIAAIRFREPDWKASAILAEFGRPRWLMPAALMYSQQDPPVIRIHSGNDGAGTGDQASVASATVEVDADSLCGRVVLSSSNDEVAGRAHDLLINVREWYLAYFIVHNGRHRVLLHASWVTGLSVDDAAIIVDGLPAQSLLTAPRYPGVSELTQGFLDSVCDHYNTA